MSFVFSAHLCDTQFCLYPQLYLTDLATRESLLLCTGEHPVLQLALHDDSIWVATTDSSVHRWPAEGRNPQKNFQRGGSFLAGNLSFSRARVSLEGSVPVSTFNFIFFYRFEFCVFPVMMLSCRVLTVMFFSSLFIGWIYHVLMFRSGKLMLECSLVLCELKFCQCLQAPVYKEPSFTIPGTPAIVQHEILNNRRHVLTKVT